MILTLTVLFQFYSFYQSIARNVFRIASDEVINDYEYMKQYIEEDKFFFTSLADKMNDDIAIKHSYDLLERNELRFGAYPKCALKSSEFFKAFSMKNPGQFLILLDTRLMRLKR